MGRTAYTGVDTLITETWRIPGEPDRRYVRADALTGRYHWCEQRQQSDIAQGTCGADDLPEPVRTICDEYAGPRYACEWST